MTGGHYISYACNPNGHWYCYNDSSCREVLTDDTCPRMHQQYDNNLESNNNDNKHANNHLTFAGQNRSINSPTTTPLMKRKNPPKSDTDSVSSLSQESADVGNISEVPNDDARISVSTGNATDSVDASTDASETRNLVDSNSSDGSPVPMRMDSGRSSMVNRALLLDDRVCFDPDTSVDTFRCAYSDVKTPKIDTSSAYILFYERSGLNYKPYLPEVICANGQVVPEVELEENESELRKQMCVLQ